MFEHAMSAPRLDLTHRPTPITLASATSARLGVRLHVKRDDLTGSHLGGNKIRKLDLHLAAARAAGATHVLTCGGVQSNHCRATALAAAPLGLVPVLLLACPDGVLPAPATANLLLDRLAGAQIHPCDGETYRRWPEVLASLADDIRGAGGVPHVIPEGGSDGLGALAYAGVVDELAAQLDTPPTSITCAVGTAGTLAGLALGVAARGWPTRVIGATVLYAPEVAAARMRAHAAAAAAYGAPPLDDDAALMIDHRGQGYARATPAELRFLTAIARGDGLVLDPVYTNKAYRGLVALAEQAPEVVGERPLFVHTGGVFGLFPFAEALAVSEAPAVKAPRPRLP